jgi:methyl-accepting chemotaxis protein
MKLTIGKKLIGSFLIIAVISGISSVIFYSSLNKVNRSYLDLVERQAKLKLNANSIKFNVAVQSGSLNAFLLMDDDKYISDIHKANDNVALLSKQSLELIGDSSEEKKLNDLIKSNQNYKDVVDQVFTLSKTNKKEARQVVMQKGIPISNVIMIFAQQFSDHQDQIMNKEIEANQGLVKFTKWLTVLISAVTFTLAMIIGVFISRMISKPMVLLTRAAELISSSDLTIEDVHVKQRDEIGRLAGSFNQMKDNLRQVIRQINSSSDNVVTISSDLTHSAEQTGKAAEYITGIMQELADGSEKQVNSMEESMQAVNEMSSGIQQIAYNAKMTSSLSLHAIEKASDGNQGIQSVTKQMDNIHMTMNQLSEVVKGMRERSIEIEMFVKVITDIALQTNLLALNASIEAARAGEQGRGFAVVAVEVRKLAEQSNHSARQITQLINNIQNDTNQVVQSMEAGVVEVEEGIRVAHAAGHIFGEIKHVIDDVALQIQDVSSSSNQLSAQTTKVVQSMKMVTGLSNEVASGTQNVAGVTEEQLASTQEILAYATSLSKMAEDLQMLVQNFKIK